MSFDSFLDNTTLVRHSKRGQSAQLRVERAWEGHHPTFQLRCCWQLQFVRNQTNLSEHLKRPIELWEKVSNFSSALLRFACKAEVQLDNVPYVKCHISSCNSDSGA